jgi:hypothetical protein
MSHDPDDPRGPQETFAVSPLPDAPSEGDAISDGGTRFEPGERRHLLRQRVANPDDPPVHRPRQGAYGPLPGPDYSGAPGRAAIVMGQIFIVGGILVLQLFLITTALYELLSGHTEMLWWITCASFVGFVLALVVARWPRTRVKGY